MTRIDVVRRATAVAIACTAAALVFIRLFGPAPVLGRMLPVIILCCVGYAAGTAGGRAVARGNGALAGLLVTIVATVALGSMTLENKDGQLAVSSVFDGLVEGFGIILNSAVPAPVNAETITAAMLITSYGALVACLLVTSFAPASSLVPATVIFITGLMLSQGSLLPAVPFAAVFIAACVVALILMPSSKQQNVIEDGAEFATVQTTPRPGRPLRVVIVALSAITVAVVSAALGPLTTLGSVNEPFDPHQTEDFRPDTDLDGDDVVSLATKWQTVRKAQPIQLFSVTGPDIPDAVNWAINDRFDGVAWSSIKTFDQIDADTRIPYEGAKKRYTVVGSTGFETGPDLPGPWLPATYRPTEVSGTPIRADEEATVIAADNIGADKVYTVDFRALGLKSLDVLQTVGAVERDAYGTTRELPPDFPDTLRTWAAQQAGSGSPYDRLTMLAMALSSPPFEENDDAIVSPLASPALEDLVLVTQRGTESQFATAFALMARSLGFPTRLVVGYGVPGKGQERTVQSTNAIIYPEVELTSVGWVAFAPSPEDGKRQVPVPEKLPPEKPKQKQPAQPKPTPTASPAPSPSPNIDQPAPAGQQSRQLIGIALVLLAGAVLWPLFVAGRRRRLRRQLRSGPPDRRVVGAWTYVRAVRRKLGDPLDDTVSPATYAADPETSPDLADLAGLAETSLYAPDAVAEDDAERAWQAAKRVTHDTRRTAGVRRRLSWYLVPLPRSTAGGAGRRQADPTDRA